MVNIHQQRTLRIYDVEADSEAIPFTCNSAETLEYQSQELRLVLLARRIAKGLEPSTLRTRTELQYQHSSPWIRLDTFVQRLQHELGRSGVAMHPAMLEKFEKTRLQQSGMCYRILWGSVLRAIRHCEEMEEFEREQQKTVTKF